MALSNDTRINVINIGLMLISCAAAFIMPFEVFLFAYAFLGPLHYLTEISWLHDRQYFTKGKYDFVILLVIGIIITLLAYGKGWFGLDLSFVGDAFSDKIIFLALSFSLIAIFIKSPLIKIVSLLFCFIIGHSIFEEGKNDNFAFLIGALVPTLIHVYLFTLLFMLFGALKSRSKSGLWSIVVLIVCPLLLYFLFQDRTFIAITTEGQKSYIGGGHGFLSTNFSFLTEMFNAEPTFVQTVTGQDSVFLNKETGEAYKSYALNPTDNGFQNTANLIFKSKAGILLMRFIAFAYTYHYLNWFSKTEIIRWHKVPKVRFVIVIALWLTALGLYFYDYGLGLQVLYFLSFSHVLLEFPLNWTSIVGIFKELNVIRKNGFSKKEIVKVN